ncbi:hypothetical protein XENOCAPTIV_010289, partial [Xenoophorus captivus]
GAETLELGKVLKNWISSSPSPPSAMAVKEPPQTLETTADCRQKRKQSLSSRY